MIRSAIFATLVVALAAGCFRGAEREKQPPPGHAGGKCAAPDGRCVEEGALCNRAKNFCYDAEDPCRGFFCGGSDRGACVVRDGLPTCDCDPGYHNQSFELYCCPEPGVEVDELCIDTTPTSASGEPSDGDSEETGPADEGDQTDEGGTTS